MPIRHISFLARFSPSLCSQVELANHDKLLDEPLPVSLPKNTSTSGVLGLSSSKQSSILSQLPARRRHRASPLINVPLDSVIGQVTRLGKFKCLDPECDELTFGRQADFKRHYENVHAPRKIEYFCPEIGCSRSRKPAGGKSKGRSFNSRKDKMEEHLRTVHHKGNKKRTRFEEDDNKYRDGNFDEVVTQKRAKVNCQPR